MNKKTKKITAYIVGLGLLAAAVVFFTYYKVDSVQVRGTTHYSDEEVKKMVLRGPLASNSVLAPMIYSTTDTDDVAFVDAFKVTQINRNTICISVKRKSLWGVSIIWTVMFFLTEMVFLWRAPKPGMSLYLILTGFR